MPLWGKTDTAADAPKFLNDLNDVFFVDASEAKIESNRAKGFKSPGWYKHTTFIDSNSNVRNRTELLVPMNVSAVEAGDLGVTGNTTVEDATVADV